jgi:flagellar protein FlbD
MIALHRLDGRLFFLNAELIETIEQTPDTVVTLTTGRKYLVQEPVPAVVAEVLAYRRALARPIPGLLDPGKPCGDRGDG